MYIRDKESSDEQRLQRLLRRIIKIGFIIGAITMLRDIWLYFQAGAWQVLVAAGGILLAFFCLLGAQLLVWRSSQRGRDDAGSKRSLHLAAYAIILGIAISYGSGELAAKGIGLSIALSGASLMVLLGLVLIPRQWWRWLIMVGAYSGFIWWINRFEPLPRYDISQYFIIRVLVFGTLALATGTVLWQLYRTVRLRTLRSQLLVAFMLVVLLPVLLVDSLSAARGIQVGRQRLLDSLDALSMLKETELNQWVARLKLNLNVEADRTKALARALLQAEPGTAEFQAAHEALLRRFQQTIVLRDDFEEFFLMDRDGQVILSTDESQEGKIYDQEAYFQNGIEGLQLEVRQVHSLYSSSLGKMTVILSRPMLNDQGQPIGVLAVYVNMSQLNKMMQLSSEEVADPAFAVEFHLVAPAAWVDAKVVDQERPYVLVASSVLGQEGKYVYSQGIEMAVRDRGASDSRGGGIYENHRGISVMGTYRWLPELALVLLAEQEESLALRESRVTVFINIGVTVGALLLAAVISLIITRNIVEPLTRLAEDATRIASGDLQHTTSVEREDEIGILAHAFNRMTARLGDLISNLEQRVAERTRDLERRSHYLAAASEVGGVVGAILDPQQLSQEVVTSMRKAFGFKYVGLFILDETTAEGGHFAILRASAGKASNERGKRQGEMVVLPIVENSMIGEAVLNEEARVSRNAIVTEAREADSIAVEDADELLTNHGWHVVLPLQARNEVLGVLSIETQNGDKQPFDKDMINVLQMVADEIAIALENARLFEQSEEALETVQQAYGELVGNAWAERFRKRKGWGYRYIASSDSSSGSYQSELVSDLDHPALLATQVVPAEGDWRPEMVRAAHEGEPVADSETPTSLALPIKSHGQVIGVLNLRSDDNPILSNQIPLLEDITNRLGLALENARLLDDSRQRAAREQLTANLAARMREPLDVDSVLRTAARELYEGLGLSRVRVRLTTPQLDPKQSGGGGTKDSQMPNLENFSGGGLDSTEAPVSETTFTEEVIIPESPSDLNEGEE